MLTVYTQQVHPSCKEKKELQKGSSYDAQNANRGNYTRIGVGIKTRTAKKKKILHKYIKCSIEGILCSCLKSHRILCNSCYDAFFLPFWQTNFAASKSKSQKKSHRQYFDLLLRSHLNGICLFLSILLLFVRAKKVCTC